MEGLEQALVGDGGVIIRGETGTGGEIFARAIHLASTGEHEGSFGQLLTLAMKTTAPNGAPFVVFDCAVANAVERRLFGAETQRSGGTDAVESIGESSAVYQALGGTLVLKNLPELPGRLQSRLARILRDGEVVITSTGQARRVDLRPIVVLEPLEDDRVNAELRRRLSQTTITMPPLRERREDMPALIRHLLMDICAGLNLPSKRASSQAIGLLAALPWRGNLQELEGMLRMLVLKAQDQLIRQADVLANVQLEGGPSTIIYGGSLKQARARFEREYVASVLAQHNGRMTDAAKTLGIQRTNLYRKVRQLAVKRPRAAKMTS